MVEVVMEGATIKDMEGVVMIKDMEGVATIKGTLNIMEVKIQKQLNFLHE